MALTKISRSLLDTGVSDSSDATAITIDSSENVGIANTSPVSKLDVTHTITSNTGDSIASFGTSGSGGWANSAHQVIVGGPSLSTYTGLIIFSDSTSGNGQLSFADGKGASDSWRGSVGYNHASDFMTLATNATERMRIDSSGNVGIGTTSDVADSGAGTTGFFWNGNRLSLAGDPTSSADGVLELNKTNSDTTNNNMLIFALDGVFQGDIDLNGGLVRYNQSSDYRLKENIVTEWDATTRLKQLKPSRFNFINHPNNTIDGFLAHEVSSIVPEAISGDKDAIDDEGNPIYQGIDHSKLVPLLVKTIQELEARITTLEGE